MNFNLIHYLAKHGNAAKLLGFTTGVNCESFDPCTIRARKLVPKNGKFRLNFSVATKTFYGTILLVGAVLFEICHEKSFSVPSILSPIL